MDETAKLSGLMASLAHLRSNAILAANTSRGQAVTEEDLERLDALALGAFGTPLDKVESAVLGMAPRPGGPVMKALLERMPSDHAQAAHAFLVDLHHRTHDWLTT